MKTTLNLFFLTVCLLILGAGGVAIAVIWKGIPIPAIGDIPPATEVTEPEVDVRSLVVQALEGKSELTTAETTVEVVVPVESDRKVAGMEVGKTSLIYVATGHVRAGMDLSEVQVTDTGTVIQVLLPSPEILGASLDVEASRTASYDKGVLGPDNGPELQEEAQRQAVEKIGDRACESGVLDLARDRAELEITNLLSGLGAGVAIEVKTSEGAAGCP